MANINIYSDEAYGWKNTFRLHAAIWGTPKHVSEFEMEIDILALENKKLLGNNSKGFHSKGLTNKNYKKHGPVYEKLIKKFVEFKKEGKLQSCIYLESKEKYMEWKEVFIEGVRNLLEDPTSDIRKVFPFLKDNEIPLIYNSFEQLYIYILLKHLMGPPNTQFAFYPDPKGSILRLSNKYAITSNFQKIPYFDFIKILGNAVSLATEPLRTQRDTIGLNQELVKFEPTIDSDSRTIQMCDLLCNFCLNSIRYLCENDSEINQYKSKLFLSGFSEEELEKFKHTFKLIDGKVVCTDKKMAGSIK